MVRSVCPDGCEYNHLSPGIVLPAPLGSAFPGLLQFNTHTHSSSSVTAHGPLCRSLELLPGSIFLSSTLSSDACWSGLPELQPLSLPLNETTPHYFIPSLQWAIKGPCLFPFVLSFVQCVETLFWTFHPVFWFFTAKGRSHSCYSILATVRCQKHSKISRRVFLV